ncbi:ATP phosphoribosyltransferase regulatory subunit [uncultured Faecalibaculum sp.]|uniref:ATP phosphoribosyltransferase regulatory subunit n=1 Tax=uncultured Faecalibaculum sp. TaxID=1729681 RepID=UPI0026171244|nr:ATP phosphoribosyltransferase regulatory subunit [uncultured Faecalibaculum sp.]
MNQIQIPAGARDCMPGEVRRKRVLRQAIEEVFVRNGCRPVSTPAMEYLSTYTAAFADADESEMFRIQDGSGDMLVLRLDMTVPIARTASTKLRDRRPLRLFYTEDVFKQRQLFGGRRVQVTDCGVEMIGLPAAGDLEILLLACQVLDAVHQPGWILETGDVRFFQDAVQTLGLGEADTAALADLIDRKSLPDLERYLEDNQIPRKEFFLMLPLLSGGREALDTARTVAFTPQQQACLDGLEERMDGLEQLGYQACVTVDLGKIPHLNYYSSLIFEGYVPGTGTSVLSGGRYDGLLEKFGPAEPACGFSVKLDYLTELEPEAAPPGTAVVRTGPDTLVQAMDVARKIREEMPCVIEYTEEEGGLEVLA